MLTSEQRFSRLHRTTRDALARRALHAETRLNSLRGDLRKEIDQGELYSSGDQNAPVALPRWLVQAILMSMDEIVYSIRPFKPR